MINLTGYKENEYAVYIERNKVGKTISQIEDMLREEIPNIDEKQLKVATECVHDYGMGLFIMYNNKDIISNCVAELFKNGKSKQYGITAVDINEASYSGDEPDYDNYNIIYRKF